MSNVIGRLRIELPGSQMRSEQECSEQLTDKEGKITIRPIQDMNDYTPINIATKAIGKESHKVFLRKETLHVYTRKSVPAIQSMPITEDFYEGCLNTPLNKVSPKHWKRLAEDARLKMHMEQIAADFNGKFIDYTLFE